MIQQLTHIRHSVNHNTKECADYYGLPFSFEGPLFNLPLTIDGKEVMLLGMQPYTVEEIIPFDYPVQLGS